MSKIQKVDSDVRAAYRVYPGGIDTDILAGIDDPKTAPAEVAQGIIEPDSLPYGGTHHGVDRYIALRQEIGSVFKLTFEPQGVHALDDRTAVLRMKVTFTTRSTALSVTLRVVELLDVQGGRVRRSEVFLADTAALLATLGDPVQ